MCNIGSGGICLILGLGNGQVFDQLLQYDDGFRGFFRRSGGNGLHRVDSRHYGRVVDELKIG